MRKSSKIICSVFMGSLIALNSVQIFAVESKSIVENKILAGANRYESAVAVSKCGWSKSENIVIVNGNAIVDALTATPYAKSKSAPILLTENDKLNDTTKEEIIRLNSKNVYIVGGEGVVSEKVVKELHNLGLNIKRISGKNRFETSLNIAKELNTTSIAIVNGMEGKLSDAMSISAPAAQNNMAILLTDGQTIDYAKDFINDTKINNSYIIGGEAVVANTIQKQLNSKRLYGKNRLETNGEVLKNFYTNKEIENMYVTKDGSINESELVDALSAGNLAGQNGSAVMLVGSNIAEGQKEFLIEKSIKNAIQVGYGINNNTVKEIYSILNVSKIIEVNDIKEFNDAMKNSKDGDLIKFNPKNKIEENLNIISNKNITVELNGIYNGKIKVNMKNGDLINNGQLLGDVILEEIKEQTFVNNGIVQKINFKDETGASIINKESATLSKIELDKNCKLNILGNVQEVKILGENTIINFKEKSNINKLIIEKEKNNLCIEKDCKISSIELGKNAVNTEIINKGKVENITVDSRLKNIKINNIDGFINQFKGDKNLVVSGKENIKNIVSYGGGSKGESSSTIKPEEKPTKPHEKPVKPEEKPDKLENEDKVNLIDKNKSSIREVQYVYYAVVKLNDTTMKECNFYIDGKEVTATKVNTEGTIVKFELKDSKKKEIKVKNGNKFDIMTLKLKK